MHKVMRTHDTPEQSQNKRTKQQKSNPTDMLCFFWGGCIRSIKLRQCQILNHDLNEKKGEVKGNINRRNPGNEKNTVKNGRERGEKQSREMKASRLDEEKDVAEKNKNKKGYAKLRMRSKTKVRGAKE